jgi:hypothetical protein
MAHKQFTSGDCVSYQHAGMKFPEYGIINAIARIEGHAFIRFGSDQHGKLTHLDDCKSGFVQSWWEERDGKWYCEDTP